jgi:pyridoxamine 5'-phosphate oxidase
MADHWQLDLSGGTEKPTSDQVERRLDEQDATPDPFELFGRWLEEAYAAAIPMPHAMVLATASADGVPSARTVLLERFDPQGFVFHTNLESPKCQDLDTNPNAALVFLWRALGRQVRVGGEVVPASAAETAAYFDRLPRAVQVMIAACEQSAVVSDRATLENIYAETDAASPAGPLPVPANWGGLRVVPTSVEFWQARPNRLQDRLRYTRQPDATWLIERLVP